MKADWLFHMVALCAAGAMCTVHAEDRAVLAPGVFVSSDSEDFTVRKLAFGWAPLYRDGNQHTSVRLARHRYAVADWSAEASQASVVHHAMDARSGLGTSAGIGLSDLGGRQLLTAEIDTTRALTPQTQGGLFLSRDWVETRNALVQGIHATYFGGSLEHRLTARWAVIGLLGQQRFSDGNVRDHGRTRIVYDWLPDYGVNLQWRHRHFWNSAPWGGNYFSPDVYGEDVLAVGLRRRLQGWTLAGAVGAGQQRVSGNGPTATHLAELELASPLAGASFLRLRTGYSDSASITGPAYLYRYLQAEVWFRF